MRTAVALILSATICCLLHSGIATAADGPPAWAYPRNNTDYKPPVDDGNSACRTAPRATRGASCAIGSLPRFGIPATYFASLQPRKRMKVIESDTAPKTYVAGLLWAAAESGERDALGARIVEVPDNLHQFESRDPRSTFTAYVPIGSIAKGEALVMSGGSGKTSPSSPIWHLASLERFARRSGATIQEKLRCREMPRC